MKHEREAGAEKEEGKENEEKIKEDEEGDMEEGRKRIIITDLLAERGERSRPQWHTGVPWGRIYPPSANVLSKIPPYFQP